MVLWATVAPCEALRLTIIRQEPQGDFYDFDRRVKDVDAGYGCTGGSLQDFLPGMTRFAVMSNTN